MRLHNFVQDEASYNKKTEIKSKYIADYAWI